MSRLVTVVAALASLLAVLTSSKLLAVVAVALAASLLVRSSIGLLRFLLRRPLAPLLTPLRRAAASLRRRFDTATAPVRRWVERDRDRLVSALRRLDDRLGGPVAYLERRMSAGELRPLKYLLRFLAWLGLVIGTLLALAAAVYVGSGWLGYALAGRKTPIAIDWFYIGAFAAAAGATLVIGFWIRSFGRLLFRRRWRKRTCTKGALLGMCVLVALLSSPEVPGEIDVERESGKLEGGRSIDVLLVVDPADRAGRKLADLVRTDLAALARPRPDALPFDVAIGVAAPVDPALDLGPGAGAWTVLEPPTANRRHALDSIAAVAPRKGATAASAYPALLEALRDPGFLQWHSNARRTLALVLERLPLEAELDRHAETGPRAAPSWESLVSAFAEERRVRPLVFTRERRPGRLRRWRAWLARMGGTLVTYRSEDATLVADIEDAATGSPVSGVLALARRYSPHLRFDDDEQFFPVDVDELLAKAGPDGGHQVCDHVRFDDNCQPADDYKDLLTSLDEYIDFESGARLGQDLVDRDVALGLRRKIYVDPVERDGRLQLGYWWFLRFNVSPWRPERNCLPGFTFAEATCFDHEGDWEGVTVTLRQTDELQESARHAPEAWELESVSFASHKNLVAWGPEAVELAGAERTHPVVYVAQGSHASYPTRCSSACTQKLAGPGLPEGHFDGADEWTANDTACCLPLPVTPEHRGALWNAFPGLWGMAACTAFVKVCSQSDGPKTPSAQARFSSPVGRTFTGQQAVLDRHRRRYGTGSTSP